MMGAFGPSLETLPVGILTTIVRLTVEVDVPGMEALLNFQGNRGGLRILLLPWRQNL